MGKQIRKSEKTFVLYKKVWLLRSFFLFLVRLFSQSTVLVFHVLRCKNSKWSNVKTWTLCERTVSYQKKKIHRPLTLKLQRYLIMSFPMNAPFSQCHICRAIKMDSDQYHVALWFQDSNNSLQVHWSWQVDDPNYFYQGV
jgi:hypothetical protein